MLTVRSAVVPLVAVAHRPSGIESRYVSKSDVTDSISVAGMRLTISSSTGLLFLRDRAAEIEPRTTLPSQTKYASYHGLSRP